MSAKKERRYSKVKVLLSERASNYPMVDCIHDNYYATPIQLIDDFMAKYWVDHVVVDDLMRSTV